MKGGRMDKVEHYKNAVIQHGNYNNRLYILKFPDEGDQTLIAELTQLAMANAYTKVLGKIPKSKLIVFLKAGFKVETSIPLFYNGEEDCCFVSRFIDLKRAVYDPKPLHHFIAVQKHYRMQPLPKVPEGFTIRELGAADAGAMAAIYRQVFETYPFPVYDPGYLAATMARDVVYFGAFRDGKLLALSSSEMDIARQNAEMTDFATLPEARGFGLSKVLLNAMEEKMKDYQMKTLYTIARLYSMPMNKTFMGAGYQYAGTLINNTNIAGGIESMNIFYKYL